MAIALYEVRVIDAAWDEFPYKPAFADKLSLFTGAVGIFEAMSQYPFRPEHHFLEVGPEKEGIWLFLTSAFFGASLTGIDARQYEYGQARRSSGG